MGNKKRCCRRPKRQFLGNLFSRSDAEVAQNESGDTENPDEIQTTLDSSSSSEKLLNLSFDEFREQSSESDSDTDEEVEAGPTKGDFSGVGCRLISLVLLFAAISSFCACKECRDGHASVKEGKRQGLATTICLSCDNCAAETTCTLLL